MRDLKGDSMVTSYGIVYGIYCGHIISVSYPLKQYSVVQGIHQNSLQWHGTLYLSEQCLYECLQSPGICGTYVLST